METWWTDQSTRQVMMLVLTIVGLVISILHLTLFVYWS
jgi:hypothetical protein